MLADLTFASAYPKEELSVSEYVQSLVKSLKDRHHVARQNLKEAQKNMKRNYDLRILERNYKEGDMVYVLDNTAIKWKSKQKKNQRSLERSWDHSGENKIISVQSANKKQGDGIKLWQNEKVFRQTTPCMVGEL